MVRHLHEILGDKIIAREQDEMTMTSAAQLQPRDAMIDWQQSAVQLQRLVRAYNPVPGAFFEFDEQRIKCWEADVVAHSGAPAGTVISADRDGIVIACGEGALRMLSLQRPGKRAIDAREFAAQVDLSDRRLG